MFELTTDTLEDLQPSARAELEADARLARRLDERLIARAAEIDLFNQYYEGRHRLGFATPKFREAFGNVFKELADNWCDLVVDAVEERLNVEGFRIGDELAGDKEAWGLWQRNGFDAASQVCHTEALVHGIAYVMVGPDEADGARLTVEHPSQVIVATDSGDRRRRVAAWKRYTDEWTGEHRAALWLPGRVVRFSAPAMVGGQHDRLQWKLRGDGPENNQIGAVPIVPFPNRPRLLAEGRSEIARVIPVQDAVNKTIADMLVTAEYYGMPQRWATGLELPTDPETGNPIDPYADPHMRRFFYSEDPDTKVGQFPAADLHGFVSVVEMLVQHIASQTRTPPHYFYLGGNFPSGESIKSAETGLVAKARRKMRHFGEAWEEVMRLAGRVAGLSQLDNPAQEVIWGDPESRTEGEHVDAVLKRQALGVPTEQLWEDLGYTPQQRARFRTMQAADRLLSPAAAMPGQPAGGADSQGSNPAELRAQADAMGVLIRAGVTPESAAEQVGLGGIEFSGAVPTSLRLPEVDAAGLE